MKPTQIVLLLLVVVAIIFGVTFASMYVGRTSKKPGAGPSRAGGHEGLHLTFFRKQYPEALDDPMALVACEFGQKAEHDFWFVNGNDEPVRLGLTGKSCKCSEMLVFEAPADWQQTLGSLLAAQVEIGAASSHPLPVAALACGTPEWALQRLVPRSRHLGELEKAGNEGVLIPARALGFIRMTWEARRSGPASIQPENLTADLWMQSPKKGAGARLMVGAIKTDGICIDATELKVGTLPPTAPVRYLVRCWSPTRSAFDLEVTSSGEPFITCGPREPLRPEDIGELLLRGGQVRGPLRSGYRYEITIREQADKGQRMDEGPFLHKVKFKPVQKVNLLAPLEVTLRGRVSGDILIGEGESIINLQPFPASDGTSLRVPLQTVQQKLNLKVDRTPDFITAHLDEPRIVEGRKHWNLTIQVKPNAISGTFPQEASDRLRDTAIYLKVEGADRRVRIPVAGNALYDANR